MHPALHPDSRRLALLLLLLALAAAGCATTGRRGRSLVPTRYETRTGPYLVYTNFPIPADAPAIRHLQSLEQQLGTTLGIRVDPAEEPIQVYILDNREAFGHFLKFHYPELPSRRAFFLAQGDRRLVYTYLGERLEEDLRHEATHAFLHAAAAELPLWLDEGLAEYFEVPEARQGVNAEHLARLPADLAAHWSPDLKRLEGLREVRQMTPRDYRESWAWVHFLMSDPSGRKSLLGYLVDVRSGRDARPLSTRLDADLGSPGDRLLAHLGEVREGQLAAARPASEPVMRFQDAPASAPEDEPARGPFGRFFDRIFRGRRSHEDGAGASGPNRDRDRVDLRRQDEVVLR